MSNWRDMAASILKDGDAPHPAAVEQAPDGPFTASLRRLRDMDQPRAAGADRWPMIVTDAAALVEEWGVQLHALGWQAGDLFGFSDDAWPAEVGLALRLRGGRVILVDADAAIILLADGASRIVHYRRPTPHPPIWLHRGRRP